MLSLFSRRGCGGVGSILNVHKVSNPFFPEKKILLLICSDLFRPTLRNPPHYLVYYKKKTPIGWKPSPSLLLTSRSSSTPLQFKSPDILPLFESISNQFSPQHKPNQSLIFVWSISKYSVPYFWMTQTDPFVLPLVTQNRGSETLPIKKHETTKVHVFSYPSLKIDNRS